MDELLGKALAFLVTLATGGGAGAILNAWFRGRAEARKMKADGAREDRKARSEEEAVRKEGEWQRVQSYLDRVDREHTEDRANLARLHEEALVRGMEVAELRARLIAREDRIAWLEEQLTRLKGAAP